MSSNKDFLPSSSPVSSICAIEIIAILFLFMMNCYKSSFQECITIIVLKDERTRNQPPCCLLQLQEKVAFHLPRSGCLGTPVTLPQSLYQNQNFSDQRVTEFSYPWCSASSAKTYILCSSSMQVLLSNCVGYCTESARNEYKYPTILYSRLLYLYLIVPFWYALGAYQASLVEPWFVISYRDQSGVLERQVFTLFWSSILFSNSSLAILFNSFVWSFIF